MTVLQIQSSPESDWSDELMIDSPTITEAFSLWFKGYWNMIKTYLKCLGFFLNYELIKNCFLCVKMFSQTVKDFPVEFHRDQYMDPSFLPCIPLELIIRTFLLFCQWEFLFC